jgi:hypothetical protein
LSAAVVLLAVLSSVSAGSKVAVPTSVAARQAVVQVNRSAADSWAAGRSVPVWDRSSADPE